MYQFKIEFITYLQKQGIAQIFTSKTLTIPVAEFSMLICSTPKFICNLDDRFATGDIPSFIGVFQRVRQSLHLQRRCWLCDTVHGRTFEQLL